MTCSPWQKLHLGLTVAAYDDRLAFDCDFASIFFAEDGASLCDKLEHLISMSDKI